MTPNVDPKYLSLALDLIRRMVEEDHATPDHAIARTAGAYQIPWRYLKEKWDEQTAESVGAVPTDDRPGLPVVDAQPALPDPGPTADAGAPGCDTGEVRDDSCRTNSFGWSPDTFGPGPIDPAEWGE